MAAKHTELDALHKLVTKAFTEGIELDIDDKVYNPALLSAAAKFLKDNEISADIKSDDDLQTLRDKMRQQSEEARKGGGRLLHAVNTMPRQDD